MSLARSFLLDCLEILRSEPQIAYEIRTILAGPSERAQPEAVFARRQEFATRHRVSVRTVGTWLASGLPHTKTGRAVRIPVAQADEWLANGGDTQQIAAISERDAKRYAKSRALEAARITGLDD